MLHEVLPDNLGADIRYRYDGGLFTLSRLRSKHLTHMQHISELQYVDGNAVRCHSKAELQQSLNNFAMAYHRFDLTVNIKKTKVLAQTAPNTILPDFDVTISDTPLKKTSISIKKVNHKLL
ncbi:Hypothetical predicted protein [Octopus vulgaris]|uniref:Reverse transcriptase domain-containing protein n=1 Tax=Octopus vulgaris TaxID=6645 RepID=A0AA36EZL0_OCTVU|nr:Hypothetical predicted protein [Octopus vulgaris]